MWSTINSPSELSENYKPLIYIYIYIYRSIGIMASFHHWSGRPEFNIRTSHTKHSKMVHDASLLNTKHYKVQIEGKVEQFRERRSALPYTSVS